jgi:ribosome modulation factor
MSNIDYSFGSESMQSAYSDGAQARSALQSQKANPYPYATNLWSCWMAGWNDCDMAQAAKKHGRT